MPRKMSDEDWERVKERYPDVQKLEDTIGMMEGLEDVTGEPAPMTPAVVEVMRDAAYNSLIKDDGDVAIQGLAHACAILEAASQQKPWEGMSRLASVIVSAMHDLPDSGFEMVVGMAGAVVAVEAACEEIDRPDLGLIAKMREEYPLAFVR